ncbi:MAG: hypothetical protein KA795_03980 [Burkholderiaceae bacterium]|nr:hypothetical protein [Burkholderiaceae bacterium]
MSRRARILGPGVVLAWALINLLLARWLSLLRIAARGLILLSLLIGLLPLLIGIVALLLLLLRALLLRLGMLSLLIGHDDFLSRD